MDIFVEISLIIVIATLAAGVMRLIKQPLILGHIITGLLVGPQFFNITQAHEAIDAFAKIGIAILLYIVGIGLSPMVIREVGKISLITGFGQVLFTSLFGFIIARLMDYSVVSSLYIAVALTFSSTIIILTLLTEKRDVHKLYGRISIGFLLVQDLIAMLILIVVTSLAESDTLALTLLLTLAKGIVLAFIFGAISKYLLPKLEDFFASSQEFLFLFTIGWGLGLAWLFHYAGFSIEIGALVAGVTLSVSPYGKDVESKLKPLREFFIIMFFVLLGSEMTFDNFSSILTHAGIFSVFVLFGNPFIVFIMMGALGYNSKTGFMAGLTVAQISEFSLILVLLGLKMGHIDSSVVSMVTIVGLITIAGSTYLIMYADQIWSKLGKFIGFLERKNAVQELAFLGSYEVILLGCSRSSFDFLEHYRELKEKFLIVDFDPRLVSKLKGQGLEVIYGNAEDVDFLDEINIGEAKMIYSTIPDHETNLEILAKVRSTNKDSIVVVVSFRIHDALALYEAGASYVLLPHLIGGELVSEFAKEYGEDTERFSLERAKHIRYLRNRLSLGQLHPIKASN